MTGAEHYLAAEGLRAGATLEGSHPDGSPLIRQGETDALLAAVAHSVLALAAATASESADRIGWMAAVYPKKEQTDE
jgi:hypothetical protein